MKKVIALNGVHGSGKSTLGKMLAGRIGGTYYLEIGGELRKQTTDSTMQSGEAFDRAVMEAEIARDRELLELPGIAVVETWHYGNLAYAQNRSPLVYSEYVDRLRPHMASFEATAILLEIGEPVFLQRMSERVAPADLPDYLDFFRYIHAATQDVYRALGTNYVRVENSGCVEDAFESIFCELKT